MTQPQPLRSALMRTARREWQRLWADGWDLAMITWLPLLFCGLTWWLFAAGIPRDLPMAVLDQDRSALSRQLTRFLEASPGLAVVAQPQDEAQAMSLLQQGAVWGVLVVPGGFEGRLVTGRSQAVQWFYNGQMLTHAGGMARDVRTVVGTLSAGVEITALGKMGVSSQQALAQRSPLSMRLDTLFNEHTSYEPFLGLALMPALLQIFLVLAVVVSIGRELKSGSVPQWLAQAGGRWGVALAGKLVWPVLAFLIMGAALLVWGGGVRGWHVLGSGWALALGWLCFVAAATALGVALVAVILNMRMALSVTAFVTAPAFAFSGQGYPLSNMPALAWAWAQALPLTHYLQIQSRAWLGGAGLGQVYTPLLVLLGLALLLGALGVWRLQREALKPERWGGA